MIRTLVGWWPSSDLVSSIDILQADQDSTHEQQGQEIGTCIPTCIMNNINAPPPLSPSSELSNAEIGEQHVSEFEK